MCTILAPKLSIPDCPLSADVAPDDNPELGCCWYETLFAASEPGVLDDPPTAESSPEMSPWQASIA